MNIALQRRLPTTMYYYYVLPLLKICMNEQTERESFFIRLKVYIQANHTSKNSI